MSTKSRGYLYGSSIRWSAEKAAEARQRATFRDGLQLIAAGIAGSMRNPVFQGWN